MNKFSVILFLLVFFSCSEDSVEPCPEVSLNLEAFFPFDGNSNDVINSNDATVFGATLVNDLNGKNNSAYRFDGIDDYISIPHSEDFIFSEFTISAWVRIESFNSNTCQFNFIVGNQGELNNTSNGLWYLGITDNDSNCSVLTEENQRFVFRLGFMDGESNGLFSQEFVKLDTDYFLVGTYDTQVMKFFINGQLVEERTIAENIEVNSTDMTIGAR